MDFKSKMGRKLIDGIPNIMLFFVVCCWLVWISGCKSVEHLTDGFPDVFLCFDTFLGVGVDFMARMSG